MSITELCHTPWDWRFIFGNELNSCCISRVANPNSQESALFDPFLDPDPQRRFNILLYNNCFILSLRIVSCRDAEPFDFSGSGSKRSKIFGSGSDEVILFKVFFKCLNALMLSLRLILYENTKNFKYLYNFDTKTSKKGFY